MLTWHKKHDSIIDTLVLFFILQLLCITLASIMRHSILFYSIAVVVSALSHQAMVAAEELGYGTLLPEEYDRPGDEIDSDIKDMVSKMTLEEKIGQMTQLNQDLVLGADGVLNETAVEYYAQNYYVGSYLNQLAR